MPTLSKTCPNPFILPDGPVQIALSGGRTSAYMLHLILAANGALRSDVVVTFQNTGREMPQTLDFIETIADRWSVPVIWLEYQAHEPFFRQVNRQTASMNGEPFEALIKKRKYLPNQQARFCTIELKVRTAKRYLRRLGWTHWTNCVGFRADEQARLNKPPPKDRWTVWHPLADAGISKHDVAEFWKHHLFDLNLPNINGKCPLGNCDGCFLKSESTIAALIRDHPERADWWEQMEALGSSFTNRSAATFSKRYSRAGFRQFIDAQADWIFNDQGYLCQADAGECTG